METTPLFSHTNPPARLATSAISLIDNPAVKQRVANEITVSPAPETSAIFLM